MKKKELFILVISIFISINTFAISDYKIGDTLYVWAKKGLQLRSDPSFTSDPITLIDYGEYIETLDKKSIYQGYHRLGELSVIEINSKTVNPSQPYTGTIYLNRDIFVIPGITYAISIETVKQFIETNKEQLRKKGFRF